MRVTLVGGSGQLGLALQRQCPAHCVLSVPGRTALDLGNPASVRQAIAAERPDVVLNAAAYTKVDAAETSRAEAFAINAEGPAHLAAAAAEIRARLVHVSTDYVFPGDRPAPWRMEDPTCPCNAYGESKLAGERAVLGGPGDRTVIVRTSWLYSRDGGNFVSTMLRLMRSREEIPIVYDQVGSPTSADSLAAVLWRVVEMPAVRGILHWTDEGVASWYDFAVAIQEEALQRGLLARPIPLRAIRTAEYPTPARRPAYSVLDKASSISQLGIRPEHWRVNLRKVLDEIAAA